MKNVNTVRYKKHAQIYKTKKTSFKFIIPSKSASLNLQQKNKGILG